MNDDLGGSAAQDVVQRHFQRLDTGLFDLVDVARSNTTASLNDYLAILILDIQDSNFTTQTRCDELQAEGFILQAEYVGGVESVQHLLGGIAERAQQHRSWQLAATVDTHEHAVFRIELEVQPRTAVRNDPRGVQEFAGAVRLAAVVVEEHTR